MRMQKESILRMLKEEIMVEENFIAQELQEKKHVLEIYKQDTEIWKTKMESHVLSNALIGGIHAW